MSDVIVKKSKSVKKNAKPLPAPKRKTVTFGQFNGVYKGLIIEHEDTWD